MTKPKLKPCPFCGAKGPHLQLDDVEYHGYIYHVHCVHCGGSGGAVDTRDKAIEIWNRREK